MSVRSSLPVWAGNLKNSRCQLMPQHLGKHMCFALIVLLTLFFLTSNTTHGQDQTSDVASKVIRGVVSNSQNNPAPSLTLDFWIKETKIGSTTSDDSGAFEVSLDLDKSSSDSIVQVSSEKGHGQFSMSDNVEALALHLNESAAKAAAPTWVLTFFATILPIVVLAIVVMAIRNRRTIRSSD